MIDTLRALRKKVVVGFLGGSDLSKITEQLHVDTDNGPLVFLACLRVLLLNFLSAPFSLSCFVQF